MARPTPLHAQLEDELLDYAAAEREYMRDNLLDQQEEQDLLRRQSRINRLAMLAVRTMRHIGACFNGSKGIDSPAAIESFDRRAGERMYSEAA